MLLLSLDVDEEDSGDLINCDNASHLYETDKLEKRTVILGEIEPATEASPTSELPPPPAACSETNSKSPRNTESNMSELTLADAIIVAIKSTSRETLRVICEPFKPLTYLSTLSGNVSEWIAFPAFPKKLFREI
ncbi:hypothetical protein EVAR_52485_1 [Eumeta japonica]|uniref:Uncharacterized protein n=1 Tax=Eumeta variegata TaxID=151549 RepID=A0A4C1Z4N6_EUMVA|nr:hypothetical protein EVAR_52485_1 [Eumeta japonica]